MPNKCVLCSNIPDVKHGIAMHILPYFNDERPEAVRRRKTWVSFVRRLKRNWQPSRFSCLCSKHFKPEDFKRRFANLLKERSVPRLETDSIGISVCPSVLKVNGAGETTETVTLSARERRHYIINFKRNISPLNVSPMETSQTTTTLPSKSNLITTTKDQITKAKPIEQVVSTMTKAHVTVTADQNNEAIPIKQAVATNTMTETNSTTEFNQKTIAELNNKQPVPIETTKKKTPCERQTKVVEVPRQKDAWAQVPCTPKPCRGCVKLNNELARVKARIKHYQILLENARAQIPKVPKASKSKKVSKKESKKKCKKSPVKHNKSKASPGPGKGAADNTNQVKPGWMQTFFEKVD